MGQLYHAKHHQAFEVIDDPSKDYVELRELGGSAGLTTLLSRDMLERGYEPCAATCPSPPTPLVCPECFKMPHPINKPCPLNRGDSHADQ